MNITFETPENTHIIKYLEKYGKVSVIKPIKDHQGKKIAKDGYFLSLYMNSSVEDSKFVEFCAKYNVVVQFDFFK